MTLKCWSTLGAVVEPIIDLLLEQRSFCILAVAFEPNSKSWVAFQVQSVGWLGLWQGSWVDLWLNASGSNGPNT